MKRIKYDVTKKYVTVTLKLAGDKLVASVKYDGGDTPVFTNIKNPPPDVPTGDNSGILLYASLLILSLSAISVILGIRRKSKDTATDRCE